MVRQIKGIEESTLEVDFSFPFTRNCYAVYVLKWNLKPFLLFCLLEIAISKPRLIWPSRSRVEIKYEEIILLVTVRTVLNLEPLYQTTNQQMLFFL